jgi:hypothetical protein
MRNTTRRNKEKNLLTKETNTGNIDTQYVQPTVKQKNSHEKPITKRKKAKGGQIERDRENR